MLCSALALVLYGRSRKQLHTLIEERRLSKEELEEAERRLVDSQRFFAKSEEKKRQLENLLSFAEKERDMLRERMLSIKLDGGRKSQDFMIEKLRELIAVLRLQRQDYEFTNTDLEDATKEAESVFEESRTKGRVNRFKNHVNELRVVQDIIPDALSKIQKLEYVFEEALNALADDTMESVSDRAERNRIVEEVRKTRKSLDNILAEQITIDFEAVQIERAHRFRDKLKEVEDRLKGPQNPKNHHASVDLDLD